MAAPKLVVESGEGRGREFEIVRPFVIGRSPQCDLVLADESCSRMHVRIVPEGGRCRFEDLGSTNGTFVNGTRQESGALNDGDRLSVGSTTLRARTPNTDPGATVVLEATLRDSARIVGRIELATLEQSVLPADPDGRLLSALLALFHSTRAAPDTHVVARALCEQARAVLRPDRVAILLFRREGRGGRQAIVVSPTDVRLDARRSWVGECLRVRAALLLEDETKKSTQYGLVLPLYRGDVGLGVLYLDRRKARFTDDELARLWRLAGAGEALLQTADLHEQLRAEVQENQGLGDNDRRVIGESPAHIEVVNSVRRVAAGGQAILLIGETGTGKELLARQIHDLSQRQNGPFVSVNCSATPEALLEGEILGARRGGGQNAATQVGAIERARGGTLFIDEIDVMDLASQARLASVLRDKQVRLDAEARDVPVDVRLIAASARDLAQLAQSGSFHEELLAILAMGTINVPPLRDRREDIPLLADHFLKFHARRLNRKARRLSGDALRALTAYNWPGNVRELSNVMERAVILATDEVISAKRFPFPLDPGDLALVHVEKVAIERALAFCHYKKGQAAKALGISWPTLNKKIQDYGIVVPEKQ